MLKPNITVEDLNKMNKNTMMEHLDLEFTGIGEDYITAKMPVDHRHHQPYGLLHGGASVVMAETLGSVAAHLSVKSENRFCVGLEINANHIKSVKSGYIHGITKPIHVGRSTQVWEIKISNEQDQLVCVSRITMAVVDKV
ncbi:MAG: hotdog fold thioesterase [Fulvivirga sp.]|nr:hotdog fold thioesterase [Fulvivirga sp.]